VVRGRGKRGGRKGGGKDGTKRSFCRSLVVLLYRPPREGERGKKGTIIQSTTKPDILVILTPFFRQSGTEGRKQAP